VPRRPLLGHAPALDGLRGLAIVIVVTFHFVGHHVVTGGWVGVDVFFCLSGFLITALMLDERLVHGAIDVRRFFARRACRLLPALVVFLALWTVVLLLFHETRWIAATPSTNGTGRPVDPAGALVDVAVSVAYLANWDVIAGGMEAPIPHLWSLAVEEQFYLVWPVVMIVMSWLAWRTRVVLLGGLAALCAVLPFLYWDGGAGMERIYFGSDTQAVALLVGALTALVWHRRGGRAGWSRGWRAWAGFGLVCAWAWETPGPETKSLVGAAVVGLATAQMIPRLVDGRGALPKLLCTPVMRWLGKRSYALYIWNYVWATWTHPLPASWGIPLGVAASLLSAELSWRYVESPALRFARRFRVSTGPASGFGTASDGAGLSKAA
jgi:peptidoglycan/LPS O-acetylase OafA/YrhL